MPPDDIRRDNGLIPTGRSAEEIDDRDLVLHRIQEPAVVRGGRIGAHEGVVHDIIACVDLAVSFALIVIPNPSARLRNTVLMLNRCTICRGLKIPRRGLISEMR
jgi:hypothetical protein